MNRYKNLESINYGVLKKAFMMSYQNEEPVNVIIGEKGVFDISVGPVTEEIESKLVDTFDPVNLNDTKEIEERIKVIKQHLIIALSISADTPEGFMKPINSAVKKVKAKRPESVRMAWRNYMHARGEKILRKKTIECIKYSQKLRREKFLDNRDCSQQYTVICSQ